MIKRFDQLQPGDRFILPYPDGRLIRFELACFFGEDYLLTALDTAPDHKLVSVYAMGEP